jgi:hypothetical protein
MGHGGSVLPPIERWQEFVGSALADAFVGPWKITGPGNRRPQERVRQGGPFGCHMSNRSDPQLHPIEFPQFRHL